jgi:hypothetical protein
MKEIPCTCLNKRLFHLTLLKPLKIFQVSFYMNQKTNREIVWGLAVIVTGLVIYFGLDIEKIFRNLVDGFKNTGISYFLGYSSFKLVILCCIPVGFVVGLIRVIIQKGRNTHTLVAYGILLLIGVIALNDFKSYLYIVGINFRDFKISLLGTGANIYPEAATLISWSQICLSVCGIMVIVNGCFIVRNQIGKPAPEKVKDNVDAPIDQLNA